MTTPLDSDSKRNAGVANRLLEMPVQGNPHCRSGDVCPECGPGKPRASLGRPDDAYARFTNRSDAEFMQYRSPVGRGPSSNTCPRCASHNVQLTAVRAIPKVLSWSRRTFSSATGAQKLGHPVPDSNLVSELNSALSQQMQRNSPFSWRFQYWPVNASSVSACRVMSKAFGDSCCFHSASVLITLGTPTFLSFFPSSENCTIFTAPC